MYRRIIASHNPVKHAKSFKYAFEGLFHALLNEPNFRVQVIFTIAMVVLGFYFDITTMEWSVLILATGFLLAAEMVNTVVEAFVDHIIDDYDEGAKIVKDLAAGFVLTAAFTTIAVTTLTFAPKIAMLF